MLDWSGSLWKLLDFIIEIFDLCGFIGKEAETIMWQQGGYGMVDSGIHSGVTTGAHSIRDEEMEDAMLFDLDSQGYTGSGFTPDQVEG